MPASSSRPRASGPSGASVPSGGRRRSDAPLAARAPGEPTRSAGATALPLRRAIDDNAPLASLLARVRASEARLAAILPTLPDGLASALRAGPLDDKAWVLLADHAAAAARLRHCLPRIEEALLVAGWPEPKVVVKVRPRA